jgi:hypothetical protein
MDSDPDPTEVPKSVLKIVDENWDVLSASWDEMYPENRVSSSKDADD